MMGVYSVHLVGESHYQAAIRRVRAGDPVSLVPEPGNPHDPRAVAVRSVHDQTIGYLERDGWVTRLLLDDGTAVSATIERLIGGEPGRPARGVVLEVRTAADVGAVPDRPPAAAPAPEEQPVPSGPAAQGCGEALKNAGCALMMLPVAVLGLVMAWSILFG